jgi:hypothetical protein
MIRGAWLKPGAQKRAERRTGANGATGAIGETGAPELASSSTPVQAAPITDGCAG